MKSKFIFLTCSPNFTRKEFFSQKTKTKYVLISINENKLHKKLGIWFIAFLYLDHSHMGNLYPVSSVNFTS